MPPTHLHFDCFCGISGDMTLGALVDLGIALEAIEEPLRRLSIGPFTLRAESLMRQGIRGTKVHVEVKEEPKAHRHLRHVNEILDAAEFGETVSRRARRAYRLLAEAEAHVHNSTPEKIHFHEVGAKDAILDVAGAMVGIELLGARSFSTSPVVVGSGMVECRHGRMPVPAPATVELLKGLPFVAGEFPFEMTTPTGAAILQTLIEESPALLKLGAPPPLAVRRVGYGGGTRELERAPNYLRAMLCDAPAAVGAEGPELPVPRERVIVLETEIDDMSPEVSGYLIECLLNAGALDAHFYPAHMKKNRPGLSLRVLCEPANEGRIAELILRETTTFGLRRTPTERWRLDRRIEEVETPLGPAKVKLGLWDDQVLKAHPEFEACRALAERHGLPLSEVTAAVQFAVQRQYPHLIQITSDTP